LDKKEFSKNNQKEGTVVQKTLFRGERKL